MSKKPPVRPGITFEIGARLEAQDYLQKWYPSKIEKMDYEEGKMLVHFERWSSRYDEWIHWDSGRIRPLERPALRKEGLRDDEENCDFQQGEEVLARWTDCRYYPAKIEAINKEGTYTVQFYDGVIRCLKKMHIKSMPEDAKGQDWIALVKAAAAAVKTKTSHKPRTSVNSSKDKEEKKGHKMLVTTEETPVTKPQDLAVKEEQPTSSQNLEIDLEEPKLPSQQHRENDLLLKRKMTQTTSFQAKRARLNQITGLLASKAVGLESAEKKPQAPEKPSRPEEASSPKPQTQKQADMCHSGITVTPTPLSPPMSSVKAHSKKEKREPGDISGSKKSPMAKNDKQLKQGILHNLKLAKSPSRNNQRRSRRTTPVASGDITHLPFIDGKGLPSIVQTPQDLSKAIVRDVAFASQEKLEPLDLSCNAENKSPISLEATIRIDCSSKEKEHLQLANYSPKALADGRIASTSSSATTKKKDKDKDRKEKEKDASKLKQKKKKKKKKKSKQNDFPECDVSSLDLLERSLSPVTINNASAIKNISFQFPRAILSVDLTGENLSDVEFLEDSSTESLILSGDEYNQEFDSAIFEESQDEDEAINEIVRCVCQMDEENGFMIQCEECLCWQHSVCMGLLEDSIPEQYVCYVCTDPPGQRWSARYRYDKDWFNSGHMCGLSYIKENYSYLNAKKIVSTHHLLADVYGVTEILHGLQLKFAILKDNDHPDLRFWACPIKPLGQVNNIKGSAMSSSNERGACEQNHMASANSLNTTDETYITSEHSYQKPQGSDHEEKPPREETGKPDRMAAMLPEGQRANRKEEAKKKRNDQVSHGASLKKKKVPNESRKNGREPQSNPIRHTLVCRPIR
ncbi:PHD finger protein 20-like protein 1 [Gastrophryne carolinensis]